MVRNTGCPNDESLRQLLRDEGSQADKARIAQHLESCEACRNKLEALAGDLDLPEQVKLEAALDATGNVPKLKELLGKLTAHGIKTTLANPGCDTSVGLGFLDPPQQPNQLGCLGAYEVTEVLGSGGMGVVLKAHDPRLNRFVAIKVLSPQLASSALARRRFLREAQAAAAVTNDHVVAIHAIDETKGLPFIVMEYIVGVSLEDRIKKTGPMNLETILRIGMQAADAQKRHLATLYSPPLMSGGTICQPAHVAPTEVRNVPGGHRRQCGHDDGIHPSSGVSPPKSWLRMCTSLHVICFLLVVEFDLEKVVIGAFSHPARVVSDGALPSWTFLNRQPS